MSFFKEALLVINSGIHHCLCAWLHHASVALLHYTAIEVWITSVLTSTPTHIAGGTWGNDWCLKALAVAHDVDVIVIAPN